MNKASGATRNPLSAPALLRALPRAVDDRPIWAQLNITWRCNLDCAYCTEYDNQKDHIPFADLLARIEKCRELGVLHTDLIGGEPLLHPDVERLFEEIRARGMTSGMTTNGFLLTEEKLDRLLAAGLGRLQISVDGVRPTKETPKSLKTLQKKIELCAGRPIWFRVNTVICDETLDQVEEVARFCFERGVGVNFSVVHERGRLRRRLNNARYLEKVRWLRAEKQAGRPVATPYFLLDYYEKTLSGQPPEWTCLAGQKCFYVAADGQFHFCAHVPPAANFSDVTAADLARWGGAKGCEKNCGVDCCTHTSLPYSALGSVIASEVGGRFGALVGKTNQRFSG
ncbi:MAG TPA: radical SAM protein [Polyangia bacterium]|nr:radical SAM protein [Polyangia bacterium]